MEEEKINILDDLTNGFAAMKEDLLEENPSLALGYGLLGEIYGKKIGRPNILSHPILSSMNFKCYFSKTNFFVSVKSSVDIR